MYVAQMCKKVNIWVLLGLHCNLSIAHSSTVLGYIEMIGTPLDLYTKGNYNLRVD